MEEFINGLVEKVGLDKETAQKVVDFIQEHASELPKLLGNVPGVGGLMDQVGGLFGGDKD